MEAVDFTLAWLYAIEAVKDHGVETHPRGRKTLELQHETLTIDMRRPVLRVPTRKLNYRFMAAEAYWILSGDDTVAGIAPYNSKISQFSDDGVTFFGAYGPKIMEQFDYVVRTLREDPDTRQAGLTFWRSNPPKTKDVPCTVALWFMIREQKLNCHVFMRSNDLWLGTPYDVFTFSMLTHRICGYLPAVWQVSPGTLYHTAASLHLYDENLADVDLVLRDGGWLSQRTTPDLLFQTPFVQLEWLRALREKESKAFRRWWEDPI